MYNMCIEHTYYIIILISFNIWLWGCRIVFFSVCCVSTTLYFPIGRLEINSFLSFTYFVNHFDLSSSCCFDFSMLLFFQANRKFESSFDVHHSNNLRYTRNRSSHLISTDSHTSIFEFTQLMMPLEHRDNCIDKNIKVFFTTMFI